MMKVQCSCCGQFLDIRIVDNGKVEIRRWKPPVGEESGLGCPDCGGAAGGDSGLPDPP